MAICFLQIALRLCFSLLENDVPETQNTTHDLENIKRILTERSMEKTEESPTREPIAKKTKLSETKSVSSSWASR